MNSFTEKTTIPIGWAAAILSAIVGVVFNIGVTHAQINGLESRISKVESDQAARDRVSQQQQLKLQRLDITLTAIDKRLQSIDKKLDRMERK